MSPCPSEITFAGLADGALSGPERRELETHLDTCPECRDLVVRLVQSDSLTASTDPATEADRVGRYQVVGRVGGGAMGVVYEAYDPKLARRVALKLLRTGQDGIQSLRLVREAQSMARLSHPNVVAVHDVGEDRGEVFLVMDYVEGGSLTEWLRAETRTWQEVLEIFLAAGEGLDAAHRIGLVHRDFKPDNVVVGRDGRVGITDFGLAALIADDHSAGLDTSPTITQTGVIMGTPVYMAPEVHAGEPADARSDLFSFCVALYEGLVGQRPYVGETIAELAANKRAGAVKLPPPDLQVPAAVLANVLRGLAADPAERPASMAELNASLAAHLYLSRPRRPWRLAALAGTAAIAAAVAVAAMVWPKAFGSNPCARRDELLSGVWDAGRRTAVREAFAAVARPYAPRLAATVENRVDRYASAWLAAARRVCEDTHVRRVQSEAVMDRQMDCLNVRRRELSTFAELLSRVDATSALELGTGAFELADLDSCADSTRVLRLAPPAAALAERVRHLREEIAGARTLLNRSAPKARARLEELLAEARAVGYRPLVAEALLALGRAHDHLGAYQPAETTYLSAAAEAVASQHDEVAATAWMELVNVVGVRLLEITRASQWVPLANAALASLGRPPEMVARLNSIEGGYLAAAGRFKEAEAVLQKAVTGLADAFGPEDPTVAAAMITLGIALWRLDRMDEATQLITRARRTTEAHWGPDHPQVASALQKLAVFADEAGEVDKAIALHEQALAITAAAVGADHPNVAVHHSNLGGVLARAEGGDTGRAAEHLEQALAIQTKVLGPDHPLLSTILSNLGGIHVARGDLEIALDYFRRSVEIERRALGDEHVEVAHSLHNIAFVLSGLDRETEALAVHREELAIYEKALGPDHTEVASTLSAMGDSLLELGRTGEALAAHERAVAIYDRKHPNGCSQYQAGIQASLAQALWQTGRDRRRAYTLAEDSLRCLATIADPSAAEDHTALVTWLRERPRP